jgi:hypothetical protein
MRGDEHEDFSSINLQSDSAMKILGRSGGTSHGTSVFLVVFVACRVRGLGLSELLRRHLKRSEGWNTQDRADFGWKSYDETHNS